MTSWLTGIAAALMVAAAWPCLRGKSGDRGFAAVLLGGAAGVALTWPVVSWLDEVTVTGMAGLIRLVVVAAIGTALFGATRRIAQTPWLLRVPVLATGLAVGLAQVVLFYAAAISGRAPGAVGPELVVLWTLSLVWPLAAIALILVTLRRFGPFLSVGSQRSGVQLVMGGLGLGAITLLGAAALGILGLWRDDRGGATVVVELAAACAGIVIAVGVLYPRLVVRAAPLERWARAARALRRLGWLYEVVVDGKPDWAVQPDVVRGLASFRGVEARLYERIIAIRDGSWVLLSRLSDAEITAAVTFARATCQPPTNREVAAAAEACMLAAALAGPPRPVPPDHTAVQGNSYRARTADEPLGSVVEEAESLVLVSVTWKRWARAGLLEHFLRHVSV